MDMEFLNTVKTALSNTAQTAVKKSNEIIESTKLRMAVSDAENEMGKIMRQIGETIYSAYKDGSDPSDLLDAKCKEADQQAETIEELKLKLNTVLKKKSCPKCNKPVDMAAAFCPSCGEKFEETDINED